MMTDEEWLAKEAGLKIDPGTAEVTWTGWLRLDLSRANPDRPEEWQQFGRSYFARAPGNDLWVNFDHLPEATREALWKKHSSKLLEPFPRGREPEWFPFDEEDLKYFKEEEDLK